MLSQIIYKRPIGHKSHIGKSCCEQCDVSALPNLDAGEAALSWNRYMAGTSLRTLFFH